jgi:hypothetical protein
VSSWQRPLTNDYFVHINTYNIAYIKDELVKKAASLTGVKEKTSLVNLGLEALISLESAKRLAKLGGTEKKLKVIPRRSSEKT